MKIEYIHIGIAHNNTNDMYGIAVLVGILCTVCFAHAQPYGRIVENVVETTQPLYFATFDNASDFYENIGILDSNVYFYPKRTTRNFSIGLYAVQTFDFKDMAPVNHIKLTWPVTSHNGMSICMDIAGYIPGGTLITTADNIVYLGTDHDGNIFTAINETHSAEMGVNIYYYLDMDKYSTVCITNDNMNYRTLYIDAEEVAAIRVDTPEMPSEIAYIGGNPMVEKSVISRYIDNILVYNYVISQLMIEKISSIKEKIMQ